MAEILSLLVKPVSADCNMRCQYCFYLRPGDPYRLAGQRAMADLTLRTMISAYMSSAGRCASFGWQGGEPLLAGLDFFKKVVAYQQIYGQPGQLVSNNLQTNGTLLDENWAKFFRQYHFFVGVSLDGPETTHNHYRHSRNGQNSFQQALQGIRALRNHQVDFSILTVVNDVTARMPEQLYDYFLENGLCQLQFIPAVEWDGETGKLKDFSVGVADYRDFLCTLFDCWYNGGNPAASIRLFENILARYLNLEPEICSFKNRCGSYVVVEYNGDVYPCDFFVEEPWMLGNIHRQPLRSIIKSARTETFNNRKCGQPSVAACHNCRWNFICHFGCQHYRTARGDNYLCLAYREFFNYADQRFQKLKERLSG